MTTNSDVSPFIQSGSGLVPVPASAPPWVTPELIADTIQAWQPYYGNLTSEDALTIILNVTNLFDALRSNKL